MQKPDPGRQLESVKVAGHRADRAGGLSGWVNRQDAVTPGFTSPPAAAAPEGYEV
jgi:hypothetical protein